MSSEVQLFPTCLVELLRPGIGSAAVSLLRRHGHDPRVVTATCCGQPAWNGGLVDDARRVARRTLRALAPTTGPVVVPSGSCATMIREFWPSLFAGTTDEGPAAAVAERTVELSSFLAGTAGPAQPPRERVAYHDSCHMLRELRVREQPRTLLAAAGREVVELRQPQLCCGFGGTFSVKLPAVSTAMADEKIDDVVASGAERLVGCDWSCLMHLQGRADRRGVPLRTVHLAELLDDA